MKTLSRFLALAFFTFMLFHTGCQPDEPDEPTTGSVRDKYLGNWMAEETSTQYPNPITFNVKITADPDNDKQVLISNFYHLGSAPADRVKAIVTTTSLNLPQQTVCDVMINGSGAYSANKITWNYYINDGADIDQVTSVYTKIN